MAAIHVSSVAPANRVHIVHLFLWVTSTAILFGVYSAGQQYSPYSDRIWENSLRPYAATAEPKTVVQDTPAPPMPKWGHPAPTQAYLNDLQRKYIFVHRIALATNLPIWGIGVSGAALGAWRFITQRGGFPTQPGHWLLIFLALFAFPLLVKLAVGAPFGIYGSIGTFAMTIAAVLAVLLAILAIFRAPSVHWKLVFLMIALGFALQWLQLVHIDLPPSGCRLGLIAVAAASLSDWGHFWKFDEFHRIGVAAVCAFVAGLYIFPDYGNSFLL